MGLIHNNKTMFIGIILCVIYSIKLSDSAIVVDHKNALENIENIKNTGRLSEKNFKFKGWLMMPMLLGGLFKVAATIPLILAAATIIGTLSLISSKLALLISTILAVRSFFTPSTPPAKEMAPLLTAEDLHDLQVLLAKQEKQNFIAAQQQHQEMDYSNYLKMADANMWNRKYASAPRYFSFPENYFSTPAPLYAGSDAPTPDNNQELEESAKVAGVHLVNQLEMTRGRDEKWYGNSEEKIKILAAEEMAARANSLLGKEAAQNPNRRVGVKVTKTVTKLNG